MNLRARAWAAQCEVLQMPTPAPHRATTLFGPIVCSNLGVPHEWGVMASSGLAQPSPRHVEGALAWLNENGHAHGARIAVPESSIAAQPWPELPVVERLPLFATTAELASRIGRDLPEGVTLDDDPPHTDVVEGYGAWMADPALAELLLTPDDVGHPDRRFIVARLRDRVVGCAFVWFAAGTAYLSGIGVVEDLRGRGIGKALTSAAARLAVAGSHEVDVLWMFATEDGANLYGRMGFQVVDVEVSFDAMASRSRSA